MCESHAYLVHDGEEKLILADVASIEPTADGFVLKSVWGEAFQLQAALIKIDLMDHKIVFSNPQGSAELKNLGPRQR